MRDSLSCNALVVLFSHAFVSLLISSFFYTASISASGCFPSNITYPQRAEFQLSSTNTHNKPFNFQIPLSCSPLRLTSSVLSPHPYFSTIFRPIRGKKEPAASNSTQLWSCLLNCTVANIVLWCIILCFTPCSTMTSPSSVRTNQTRHLYIICPSILPKVSLTQIPTIFFVQWNGPLKEKCFFFFVEQYWIWKRCGICPKTQK